MTASTVLGALRSPHKKTGRKAKPHVTSWGETIDGLHKCKDGRWRVIGGIKGKDVKFVEPDERFAVARFREITGKTTARPTITVEPSPELVAAIAEHERQNPVLKHSRVVGVELDEHSYWARVRDDLINRPKYVARMTGIEQVAWMPDLTPPAPSPTLDEVGKLYHEKAGIDAHWKKKSENFWDEFMDAVGGERKTLRELTQENVAEYKAEVLEDPPSPTYVKHRFGQVKTIVAYSKAWGKWSEDRAKALAYCSILIPPNAITLDPSPISRADYRKLLDAAAASTNRLSVMTPVLLLSLNACLYGSEVTDVQWSDLNLDAGTLVMDRGKTQVARVAVLWPRTIEALKTLPRIDGIVSPFLTEATRQAHNANTITKYYRALRTAAGASDKVRFAHIRDGGYTAACSARGVDAATAQVLAGHRAGMKDHYVKRNPFMVEHACQAIEKTYFG